MTDISEHTIRCGDIELYTRRRVTDTTRPTAILLCGLGFHTFEYEPLADELAARNVNTVSFDYRGHGHSSGARGRWTLDELTHDTIAVIDHAHAAGLHDIHLVGNSLGAMIAILAGANAANVASVVASNAPAHPAEFLLTPARRILYRLALATSLLVPVRVSVNHFYRYEDLTDDAALVERIRRDDTITNARRLTISTYRELLDTWDGPAAIRRLHRPILLVHGIDDHLQPADQTRQLLAAANAPKQHRPVSAGHLPHLDAKVEFADVLATWISASNRDGET